ncbi:Protein-export membrane protein SecD/ Protein-export membrane protein SecF [Porphyromonas crevioricanis JCM 15906]|uniref:Multifunctional fusion protein n=1 Tax=Porphyromonas crevioricanis JCM 15906 TaxID=1305617 RepID=S4N6U9_9PORP|nr:protein translocase subunit SecDF [Porphyromonas crevioricanis]GAD04825.1 Protein-export membrane protein SecD/ Protein-export membrane protein SecF [Porphyromonas crevioricanis JCM 15906]SKA03945.1 SecD/SecF fusion protein [Porphyromonas crevioricanis]
MQNKGFVIVITALLALICAFYLSFSFVTRHYENKAEKMGEVNGQAYLDSMAGEKVWMGYTLKEAQKQQIGLGLDLRGGMSVVLKLNAADLLRNLANKSQDPNFLKAMDYAVSSNDQKNFIDLFCDRYKEQDPNARLTALFAQGDLRDQITANTTDEEVRNMVKEKYQSAVDASYNVIRARIDGFGVASPNLQRLEGQGRILVELPGVKDPARVRDLLQRSANLQFWRTYTFEEIKEDLIAANDRVDLSAQIPQMKETIVADTTDTEAGANMQEADSSKVEQATTATKEQQPTGKKLFDLLQPGGYGAVVGVAHRRDMARVDSIIERAQQMRLLRDDLKLMWSAKAMSGQKGKESDLYELYAIRWSRSGDPDLSGSVVTSAKSDIRSEFGKSEPVVSMRMNEEGSRKWARITKDNINRAVAIVLDGVVYSAPNIKVEIPNGQSEISGRFTIEEAGDLANVLNSGKMETTVMIEQENVIGPTLGHEAIQAGVISFIIAIILLMIYMCLAYGFIPGLIADGALIVNSFFTLGALASFQAVLTLSGIAGLVLTLGMAVDANVLIFERIKEELRSGKSMIRAIKDGYGNAFSAIFDSNLTTIITGIVLFFFGTGPIKGFATTLIIGLVASFITAVFLTRIVFEALAKKGKMDKVTFTTALTRNLLVEPKFNILGKRKIGLTIPAVIIILGLVGVFTIDLNRGIDFSGGRNFVVQFDQKVSTETARVALDKEFEGKVSVTSIGTDGDQVRIATNYKIDEEGEAVDTQIQQKLYNSLKSLYADNQISAEKFQEQIISQQKVSPSMSNDIKQEALVAVLLALIFMATYILIRFRNIAFSIGVFVSVTATTLSIIALYVLLWRVMPFTMELDTNLIAALLAIIGYSINDTVVVFDRIREVHQLYPSRDWYQLMNDAMNSTLSRTLNTSLTTFVVMLVIFILGGATMRSFTFAILLGIVIGTYSTLFVAAPIAYITKNKFDSKKKK